MTIVTIDHRNLTGSWGPNFTPPVKRSIEEVYSDPGTDSEWYVKRIKMYRCSIKTVLKNFDYPVDPRLEKNQNRKFIGYRFTRVVKKLDFHEGFDTRKIHHIDLVEYDKVGFWGRR